jgi:hypothetical protein
LKDKINELVMNSKNENREQYRGINTFKLGYQPGSNLEMDEFCVLHADSNIFNRKKDCASQILNCA